MCADHVPIRPAAVRLRVVRPPGRMWIGALESLSDCRLTSVRGWMACGLGWRGRVIPSAGTWAKKKAGHHNWHPALLLSEGVQETLDLLQCLLVYHSPSLALAKECFCTLIIQRVLLMGWRLFHATNKPCDFVVVSVPTLLIGAYNPLEIFYPTSQCFVPLETTDHSGFYEDTKHFFSHAERSFELGFRKFARTSGG